LCIWFGRRWSELTKMAIISEKVTIRKFKFGRPLKPFIIFIFGNPIKENHQDEKTWIDTIDFYTGAGFFASHFG
jgi:hypothetical protein